MPCGHDPKGLAVESTAACVAPSDIGLSSHQGRDLYHRLMLSRERSVRHRVVVADLLMAVMDSPAVWAAAAGDRAAGLAWRDAVTDRMLATDLYQPYEALVADAAIRLGLPSGATAALWKGWHGMEPWPDAAALATFGVPLAFVSNTSARLAEIAADRSGLAPRLVLSAEEVGAFKPAPVVYRTACRRLGVQPDEVLYVAGAPYDAAGAQAVGLATVLVLRRPDLPGVDGPWGTVTTLRGLQPETYV